jgi:hypothetical protein
MLSLFAATDEGPGHFYEVNAASGAAQFPGSSDYLPGDATVRSSVVRSCPRPYFPPPPPLLQPSRSLFDDETSSTGPIYEDIDRMCSYRGPPPVRKRVVPRAVIIRGLG